jgi:hypothetical protein
MPLVDIGDGGPPIDIPASWLPDWQTHVRAAIERGAHLKRVASAKAQLRQGLSVARVALRAGLPRDEVAKLAAAMQPVGDLITVADEQRILAHPVYSDVEQNSTYATPAEQACRNPPRRIRILTAGSTHHLPTVHLTITITPIKDD